MTAAVFLDRDGVLNDPVLDPADGRPESPVRAQDVVLADGAADGCRLLQEAGWLLVVVSNQPGVAKGKATTEDLWGVHARVAELLLNEGVTIGDWRYCFHHPDAIVDDLRGPCDCRKPAPGMLLDAAAGNALDLAGSWMVGDSDGDVEAGALVGCRTALIEHPGSAHRRRDGAMVPTVRSRNLFTVASLIVCEDEAASCQPLFPRSAPRGP